ncbi:hypothetical protein [Desulfogranum marinum]|nr:hypothetical protein [Desulfogranum marinum]
MGRYGAEDRLVSIGHKQEEGRVRAIVQIRYLRPGSIKPNAQLPNLRYLW